MFRENLPRECPPADAFELDSPTDFWRLIEDDSPSELDLIPHLLKYPERCFDDECCAMGLSIYAKRECVIEVKKLPRLKNLKIYRITLDESTGLVKQTFKPSHHTWWPYKLPNILDCFQEAE
jgi:hypothetical protein